MKVFRTIATLIAITLVVIMFGCTGSDSPRDASALKEQVAVSSGADTGCSPGQLSITSNFNGTPIMAGDVIWFSAVFKPSGLGATTVHLFYRNGTITLPGFPPIAVPDADITLVPGATSATATLVATDWVIDLPTSFSGNAFLSGVGVEVPSGLPGGESPVTWSGTITADAPVDICWKWAAAVYTQFPDIAAPAVKAVDDNHLPPYLSSDHAGTPEDDKAFVTGGARGGGGANYTGSLTGTQCITVPPCGCIPATTCPPGQNCGTAPDECGGTIDCGTCTPPDTCGGGGTANQCGCTPTTTCPPGQECGTAPDGCGGTVDCGTCPSGDFCADGTCQPGCTPFGPTTGADEVVCNCPDSALEYVVVCGSCSDPVDACSTACMGCGGAGQYSGQCVPNQAGRCETLSHLPECTLPVPIPPLGPDLVHCGCNLSFLAVNACGSCDNPVATCEEVCATCGGDVNLGGTGCLQRNDTASCPPGM